MHCVYSCRRSSIEASVSQRGGCENPPVEIIAGAESAVQVADSIYLRANPIIGSYRCLLLVDLVYRTNVSVDSFVHSLLLGVVIRSWFSLLIAHIAEQSVRRYGRSLAFQKQTEASDMSETNIYHRRYKLALL